MPGFDHSQDEVFQGSTAGCWVASPVHYERIAHCDLHEVDDKFGAPFCSFSDERVV